MELQPQPNIPLEKMITKGNLGYEPSKSRENEPSGETTQVEGEEEGHMELPAIKVEYNGKTRRFRPHDYQCFEELKTFIQKIWSELNDYELVYVDDEDDLITVSVMEELSEALRITMENGSKSLKMKINEKS